MNFNSISTFYINLYKLNNQELFLARSLIKLKPNTLAILNLLIWYSNAHGRIFPSHETLAYKTGLCTKTISRHLKLLVKLGFILIRYLHRNSNSYYLNPVFLKMKFRNAMRFLLTNLKWFTFKLILTATLSTLAFENTCLLETVRPLIYNTYIKNNKQNNVMYKQYLKNQSVANVKVYKDVVNVTNRKQGGSVMLQSEIIISGYVAKIAKQFGFTEEQEIKLSAYSDDIVRKAYKCTLGKKIERPFNYLLRVCSIESEKAAKQPKITRLEATAEPMAVKVKEVNISGKFHKNYTAVEIAKEMFTIETTDAKGKYGGEVYKQKILKNYADKEYIANGSQEEYVALCYIDKFRLRFNMIPRCVKFEPQSTTLNENDVGEVMGHSVKKDSTSLIYERSTVSYERDEEYEEVTDEILYG